MTWIRIPKLMKLLPWAIVMILLLSAATPGSSWAGGNTMRQFAVSGSVPNGGISHCTERRTALGGMDTASPPVFVTNTPPMLDPIRLPPIDFFNDEAGTDWRVLIRPGGTFAVFFTETGLRSGDTSNKLVDLVPFGIATAATAHGNYDEDIDDVPDFAERVYACLETAHARYRQPTEFDLSAEQIDQIRWMTSNGGRKQRQLHL